MSFLDPNIVEAEPAEIASGDGHVPGVAILVAIPADLAAKARRCGLGDGAVCIGHEILLTRKEIKSLLEECESDGDDD